MSKVSDNHFMDFPAIMQDGRLYTDYKSSCIMNAKSLGMTSFEYRNYLTQNGLKIIQNNDKIVNEIAGCGDCSDYSVVPPYAIVECDQNKCIQNVNSPSGLGVEIQKHLSENKQKKMQDTTTYINNNNTGNFTFEY